MSNNDAINVQARDEWQEALIDLLNAGGMEHFDLEKLEERALRAQFHRILEMVYEKRGEWDRILPCYTSDPKRRMQAFVFVQKVFIESDLGGGNISNQSEEAGGDYGTGKPSRKTLVERSVLRHLSTLVEIDRYVFIKYRYIFLLTLV